ncbi:MAG TPA: serine hydrolase, partial [Candidatus Cybelea sp.]|nr:serine hydrolase [Candidatus Cybelea sp.]
MINRRDCMLLAGTALTLPAFGRLAPVFAADADEAAKVRKAVDDAMRPVIAQYKLPGLVVGVTIGGNRYFAEYGLASSTPRIPATRDTLFELGSVSKTFTATVAAYAEVEGKLKLDDRVGQHMPEFKDSPIGAVRLLDLGTHTAGGFPLQIPADVKTDEQLTAWYRAWKPKFAPGTMRTYANPSIALLGKVTARAMGADFAALAEGMLFPQLELQRTYITVPAAEMASYAWGTNADGKPVRVGPSPIATEAYGVKTNAVDMLRFLEGSMSLAPAPDQIARAVATTHTGYYRAGPFIQDLIWEQYPWPAKLDDMMRGNSSKSLATIPATAITPPMAPRADVILNK